MDGIASMLDAHHTEQVLSLWYSLRESCTIPEVRSYLAPHFSWHVAEAYQQARINSVMENCCKQIEPFTIKTSGLGIFSGDRPIVYINIIKDHHLLDVHRFLWEAFTPLATNPRRFYSPDYWVPHITLFFDDIFNQFPQDWNSHDAMICVLDTLSKIKFEWEIQVDNFAFGKIVGEEMEFQSFPFSC